MRPRLFYNTFATDSNQNAWHLLSVTTFGEGIGFITRRLKKNTLIAGGRSNSSCHERHFIFYYLGAYFKQALTRGIRARIGENGLVMVHQHQSAYPKIRAHTTDRLFKHALSQMARENW